MKHETQNLQTILEKILIGSKKKQTNKQKKENQKN